MDNQTYLLHSEGIFLYNILDKHKGNPLIIYAAGLQATTITAQLVTQRETYSPYLRPCQFPIVARFSPGLLFSAGLECRHHHNFSLAVKAVSPLVHQSTTLLRQLRDMTSQTMLR